ncbi:guanylate cyclase 32E-like [Parasteatoda tepidariorum]|uniref:guanylate cyclase 32E-like n=1 Tax=Parasteatoda tepidariorum TaxID=114398 RepID=UPI0039BC5208
MKVALLYSTVHAGNFIEISRSIINSLHDVGVQINFKGTWNHIYHHGYSENPFDKLIVESYQDTRIYVIVGYNFEYLGMMMSLRQRGLLDKGEYFVVGVDIEQYDIQNPMKYLKGLLKEDIEEEAKKAFQFYLGVVASPSQESEDFTRKVNYYMQLPPFNFPNPVQSLGGWKKIPSEGSYLYDAVYVYAKALNRTLIKGENPLNGTNMMKYIFRQTYFSIMGFMVYMDENGDAEGNYTLIARKEIVNRHGEFGLYPVGVFQLPENKSAISILKFIHAIDWMNGKPPLDEPICGFQREKCVMWKLAALVSGIMAALILLILLFAYKNWLYEQDLDNILWKIDYKDIQIYEYTPTSRLSKQTLHPIIRTSQVSLSSNTDGDFRYTNIYTTVGIYKGRMLAVKKLKKKSIDITRKMKKELKMMRDLHHENLNSFIGACIEPPNVCIVTEYCSRGSLKDILENEDVKLDNMFNSSLISDIVRGMIYLHDSPIHSHGNLKTSNCLVDGRWVVKLSDFGLHELKFGLDFEDCEKDFEEQCEKLLWKSPEILRDPYAPNEGTQKGDIYSFGIILYEIIGRKGPYGYIKMTPSEIIKSLIQRDKCPPLRPNISKLEADNVPECVLNCMQECWCEEPEYRPDFKIIRSKLRPMRREIKPNIFDNILLMMEKYADNLEALVDERTNQLNEEKKKTDALLYEMLPKYVADQLKKGHKVQAESFDCVTIFFSDIVGFTSMSARSSPLEVVDFLNNLYTCFDAILENYDVYKVETVGDAYMVVSGLPVRNGDRHASEIASMALHLLEAVNNFPLNGKPTDSLLLRIGIHSGAVCAGVVGKKMPRYCLFGDTVNTASRMESSGLPLRIHCSESFRQMLLKLGGYTFEERGTVHIKGKGEMVTYWLIGQEKYRIKNSPRPATNKIFPNSQQVTRSSLKQRNRNTSPTFNRKFSLDSRKILRFDPQIHTSSSKKHCKSNPRLKPLLYQSKSYNSFFQDYELPNLYRNSSSSDRRNSSCPCLEGD